MAEKLINFIPVETIPLTASTSSSNAAFILTGSATSRDVMVCNAGSNIAFVAFFPPGTASAVATLPAVGTNNATATPFATPVLPGAIMLFTKNQGAANSTICAAITSTGSSQLYFTSGQGN